MLYADLPRAFKNNSSLWKFGGQTECIMETWKLGHDILFNKLVAGSHPRGAGARGGEGGDGRECSLEKMNYMSKSENNLDVARDLFCP